MDSSSWLFLFAAISAGCALLNLFRIDIRILRYCRVPGTNVLMVATRREKLMGLFVMVSLVFCAVGWYRIEPDLPEFDAPQHVLLNGWMISKDSNGMYCSATVNGDRLWSYRKSYKLAAGCLVYNGIGDILDAPYIQQSPLYDIREGPVNVRAQWGASFPQYMQDTHSAGNYVPVFLVPVGVTTSQFNTLRQARALGVRIIATPIAKFGP